MFLLLLATTANGHLGLPSHINLKQLHLQIILTEFCSEFHEILAFRQNRACKQEVGHCDLILLYIFPILIILKIMVQLMLYTKFQPNTSGGSGEKK